MTRPWTSGACPAAARAEADGSHVLHRGPLRVYYTVSLVRFSLHRFYSDQSICHPARPLYVIHDASHFVHKNKIISEIISFESFTSQNDELT